MKLKCTYCSTLLVLRDPPRTRRAGVSILRLECPKDGEKFLATEGEVSHPYQTHKKYPKDLLKRVRTVRLSDTDMQSVEAGRLRLTVINGRITLAV